MTIARLRKRAARKTVELEAQQRTDQDGGAA